MKKNKVNLKDNKKNLFLFVFIIFFLLIVQCFFGVNIKAIITSANPNDSDGNINYKIAISVNISGTVHYLVDTNEDGKIDSFYNTLTDTTTDIEMQSDGSCLINIDTDSDWDYIYTADKSIKPFNYESKPESSFKFPWLTAAITIIIVILIVIFILFKKGIFYVYEEEYEVEE